MTKKQRRQKHVQFLPHDIICQVLARTPAHSLVRFKCVCKLWCSTISDPRFVEFHARVSRTRRGGYYYVTFSHHRDRIIVSFKGDGRGKHGKLPNPIVLKLKQEHHNHHNSVALVCQPLNGLICLSSRSCQGVVRAIVLNITTREIFGLPNAPFSGYLNPRYALGFDSLTRKYKVLSHCAASKKVVIYTIGTDKSWRELSDSPLLYNFNESCNCINGTIYWLNSISFSLSAFDVNREVFRTIRLTEDPPDDRQRKLLQVEGWLALIVYSMNNIFRVADRGKWPIQLWLLGEVQEDDSSVCIKEKITFVGSTVGQPDRFGTSGISPKGEIVLMDSTTPRKVYVDLKNAKLTEKRFKWPSPVLIPPLGPAKRTRYHHVENMVRLRGCDEHDVQNQHDSFLLDG